MELETVVDPCSIDGRHRALVETLHLDLHALCQPLTALQCVLELARMSGDAGAMLEAVDGGLEQTRRMFAVVSRIRTTLRAEDAAAMERSTGPMN